MLKTSRKVSFLYFWPNSSKNDISESVPKAIRTLQISSKMNPNSPNLFQNRVEKRFQNHDRSLPNSDLWPNLVQNRVDLLFFLNFSKNWHFRMWDFSIFARTLPKTLNLCQKQSKIHNSPNLSQTLPSSPKLSQTLLRRSLVLRAVHPLESWKSYTHTANIFVRNQISKHCTSSVNSLYTSLYIYIYIYIHIT